MARSRASIFGCPEMDQEMMHINHAPKQVGKRSPPPRLPFPRRAGSTRLRRERILQVVSEILEEGDLGQCSMSAIATRCRLSKKTLYTVFSSKEELVDAMLQDALERHVPATTARKQDDALEVLLEELLNVCSVLSSSEGFGVFLCAAIQFGSRDDIIKWLSGSLGKFLEERVDHLIGALFSKEKPDVKRVRGVRSRAVGALTGVFIADTLLSSTGARPPFGMTRDDLRQIVEIILTASRRPHEEDSSSGAL